MALWTPGGSACEGPELLTCRLTSQSTEVPAMKYIDPTLKNIFEALLFFPI
jgi:hypothetical protein